MSALLSRASSNPWRANLENLRWLRRIRKGVLLGISMNIHRPTRKNKWKCRSSNLSLETFQTSQGSEKNSKPFSPEANMMSNQKLSVSRSWISTKAFPISQKQRQRSRKITPLSSEILTRQPTKNMNNLHNKANLDDFALTLSIFTDQHHSILSRHVELRTVHAEEIIYWVLVPVEALPKGRTVQTNSLCPLLFLLEDFFGVFDGSSFEKCDVQQGKSNAQEQVKPILVKYHAKSSDIRQRYRDNLQRRFDQSMPVIVNKFSKQMHPNGTSTRYQTDTLADYKIMSEIYNDPNDLKVYATEVELKEGYWGCCFFLLCEGRITMKFKTVGKVRSMQMDRSMFGSVYAIVANLYSRYFKKSYSMFESLSYSNKSSNSYLLISANVLCPTLLE